ncbi:hypothetical protein [Peribacillus sp. NPDC097295]
MSMDVNISPLYAVFGIVDLVLRLIAIPAIIYGLYLLRKISRK